MFARIVLGFMVTLLMFGARPVLALEKRVNLEFDKNFICCIVNHATIAEKLEAIDGINTAHFISRKRKVIVYYEPLKIKIESIVEGLSKITKVDRKFIAAEAQ